MPEAQGIQKIYEKHPNQIKEKTIACAMVFLAKQNEIDALKKLCISKATLLFPYSLLPITFQKSTRLF